VVVVFGVEIALESLVKRVVVLVSVVAVFTNIVSMSTVGVVTLAAGSVFYFVFPCFGIEEKLTLMFLSSAKSF
jgi:hypothetical protein